MYAKAYGLSAVSLRYFNAAGASAERGEDHDPETHLIPNILRGALGGAPVRIFGTDYDTPDGTCIRDYIHVLDLADAHLAALELTGDGDATHVYCNLGSGSGFSVLRFEGGRVGRRPRDPAFLRPRRGRPGDPRREQRKGARAARVETTARHIG